MTFRVWFWFWWLPPVEGHKANPAGDEDDTQTELTAGSGSVTPLVPYRHLPAIGGASDVPTLEAALEGTPNGGTAGGAAMNTTVADSKRHSLPVGHDRHENPHGEKSNPGQPPDRHDTRLSPCRRPSAPWLKTSRIAGPRSDRGPGASIRRGPRMRTAMGTLMGELAAVGYGELA